MESLGFMLDFHYDLLIFKEFLNNYEWGITLYGSFTMLLSVVKLCIFHKDA